MPGALSCPFCGADVIPGDDACDACGHSLTHLSKHQPNSAAEARVLQDRIRVLEPRPPIVVDPQTPVAEVLDRLVKHGIGCVVVVREGRIQGIFSERDALLRLNTRFADLGDRPVAEFMTQAVETLSPDDRIAFALHRMDLGGFRHIPIVKDGEVVGVISVRDILRYLADTVLEEAGR